MEPFEYKFKMFLKKTPKLQQLVLTKFRNQIL